MTLPYDPVEQIREAGSAFIRVIARHDSETRVPSCSEWTLGDLAWHVGGVWAFWAAIVERHITDVGELRTIERPERVDGEDLVEFVYSAHVRLCEALHATPPDTPVWTWTGANRDVAWVARRMTQETVVHLWDASDAIGDPYVIPTAIAADGIDEFLMWFAAAERCEGAVKVGGTVHLHCTDTADAGAPGEWFIAAMKEPAATFTREHRKADCAIRAGASDLLLWLWRRNAGPVEVVGDTIIARRFRAFTTLD